MDIFFHQLYKHRPRTNSNAFQLSFLVLIFLSLIPVAFGQKKQKTKIISGVVIEAETKETIPGANIIVLGTTIGTTTDFDGHFTLNVPNYSRKDSLSISFVGFEDKHIHLGACNKQMKIKLHEEKEILAEVILTPDYSYDELLMKRIIKNKSKNNPAKIKELEFIEDIHTTVFLSNLDESYKSQKKFKKSQDAFIPEGNSKFMVPISIAKETFDSKVEHGRIERAVVNVEENSILDNLDGILKNTVDNKLADNFNFYTDVVQIFNKPIPSPISSSYKLYYKVYLADSLEVGSIKKYKFNYFPKSKTAPAFKGHFWVDNIDYAVNQITAEIPLTANVNFIKKYKVDYSYKKWPNNKWYANKLTSHASLVLSKESKKKQKEFKIIKESKYKSKQESTQIEIKKLNAINFDITPEPIRVNDTIDALIPTHEQAVNGIKVMKNNPFVKTIDKLGSMTLSGYYSAGKLDIGPYFDFFYKNEIEGNRYNIPLRTSERFSEKFTVGGYLGYGSRDESMKYGLNFNYLFDTEKRLVLKMQYFDDYRSLPRNPYKEFVQENPYGQGSGNILTVFQKRNLNPYLLRQRYVHANLEYQITPELQIKTRPFYRRFSPNRRNPFLHNGEAIQHISNPGLLLDFRYSKDLTFEQAYFTRIYYGAAQPVIHLTTEIGQTSTNKHGNSEPYMHINASMKKIIFLGPAKIKGFIDFGKILGNVPYPLYYNPESVQGIALARYAYNLMDDYALSSTTYSNLHILSDGGGILFNKIPLLNRLKLREAVSFKMFYGDLKNNNNYRLDDHPKVQAPNNNPYMEIGAGIGNIFSFLRIEYLYRINNGVFYDQMSRKSAIKFRMEVSF
ncbi:MAG: carboxypeptidase-like regulatory domain-containing protein [Flavobacteriales bacterium]